MIFHLQRYFIKFVSFSNCFSDQFFTVFDQRNLPEYLHSVPLLTVWLALHFNQVNDTEIIFSKSDYRLYVCWKTIVKCATECASAPISIHFVGADSRGTITRVDANQFEASESRTVSGTIHVEWTLIVKSTYLYRDDAITHHPIVLLQRQMWTGYHVSLRFCPVHLWCTFVFLPV